MNKLLKLLNEYSSLNWLYYLEWVFVHDVEKDVPHLHYTVIISKEYWFIKRLVDNNKIDTRKIDEDRLETIQYSEKERITIYDWLLMLLAIKDKPIKFLISVLK